MKDLDFLKTQIFLNKGMYNHEIKENTIPAFIKAIVNNYGIVFNVQLTKDQKIIIFNDQDLSLFKLKDEVKDITYEELNYLCSYKIPSLEEALKEISGSIPIIIIPKGLSLKYTLEKKIADILDNYQGKFAILSKQPITIKWFNINRPDYIIGEIISKRKVDLYSLKNTIANYFIKPDFKSVNINYNDIQKIKQYKNNSLTLGFLIDNQEKYDIYHDYFDNLIVDNIEMIQI